jgi:type VI secretion system protein ImpK
MKGTHLSDCFIDVMAYVSYLLKSVETSQPLYEEVHNDIKRLLSESEAYPARGEFPREDYDQARFAICAWVDEAILGSGWQQKNYWLNCQLQRVYYHTADAGEQFFERLKNLGLQQREVREIYYLCLTLGFTGRYCHPGDEYQLEQIKTSQLKLLLGSSVGLPALEREELFPEAQPSGDPQSGKKSARAGSRLVSAICLAAPVLLFCIMYLIYHFTLSGISENFLRTVIR